MLKNQPNKMGTTPQHIHTIPTSCAILPTMHNKKLFTHSLNEHGILSTAHSTAFHIKTIHICHIHQQKILQHNLNPQHTITAHSFCIQDRLYLPCSVATTLQPPTTQHTPCTSTCTTHSNTLPTTFLNPPMYTTMHTTNKHKT